MKRTFVLLLVIGLAGCHHEVRTALQIVEAPKPIDQLPAEPSKNVAATSELSAIQAAGGDSLVLRDAVVHGPSIDELLLELADAYFDYDRHELRPDARQALTKDAGLLKAAFDQAPDQGMIIEGHCDERGSAEYNMALGAMRAEAAKSLLVELGIPGARVTTTTYGKERPQCTEHSEECWQRNRRDHVAQAAGNR